MKSNHARKRKGWNNDWNEEAEMKTCQLDENIGFQSQQPTKSLLAHGMSM